jgi:hypothetical protein
MLRALVALLLLANLGFYAWTQGWLGDSVNASSGEREPQRIAQQVRADLVRIVPPGEAPAASAAARVAVAPAGNGSCVEAGPFTEAQWTAAEQALQQAGVPSDRWTEVVATQPGVWLLYMGRYASRDALLRKTEELQRRAVAFEELRNVPTLMPGLSLGRFTSAAAADEAHTLLLKRGVQTARVVPIAPTTERRLRIADAEPALLGALRAIRSPALGAGFGPCAAAPAG